MRVLPYFQSMIPKSYVARSRSSQGIGSLERQIAPAPSDEARPLQDKFIPTSLATGIVYSIKPDSQVGMSGTGGEIGSPGQTPGIVKSGMYRLYRLDGSLDKKPVVNRGENLDLRG